MPPKKEENKKKENENDYFNKKTLSHAISIARTIISELLLLPDAPKLKEFKKHIRKKYNEKSKELLDIYVLQELRFKDLIKKIKKHMPDEASQKQIHTTIKFIFEKVKYFLSQRNPIELLKKWMTKNKRGTTKEQVGGTPLLAIPNILFSCFILYQFITIAAFIVLVIIQLKFEEEQKEKKKKEKQKEIEQLKKEFKEEILNGLNSLNEQNK